MFCSLLRCDSMRCVLCGEGPVRCGARKGERESPIFYHSSIVGSRRDLFYLFLFSFSLLSLSLSDKGVSLPSSELVNELADYTLSHSLWLHGISLLDRSEYVRLRKFTLSMFS
mmetsp:Transcript_1043/g.2258  ORF Transcript_1043/g.2258 Transcript_1043/m.2258 type:complete len:113 (+) Transcript_1043:2531-2869(+)